MRPEELANLPLELEGLFYDLQDRIMTDVVRRINKTGGITSTADYQLQKYNILGGTTEMIENEIKRLSGKTDAAIWEIYDKVIEADYTRYKPLYEQINGSFLQYDDPENEILQSWVSGIVAQTQNGVRNISKSLGFMIDMGNGKKAFTPLADYYHKYVDAACLDIVTGSFSYDQVLRKTVKQMSASGLQTVEYASGWHNRAPVAARRAVMTGVHQISNNINEMVAKQLGTDYFEVTAHAGARPSHMTWQGKVFKHSDLVSVCGLGDVGGLCGANCRHSYYAFFPGISSRAYSDEQLQQIIDEDMQTKTWQGIEYNGYERTQRQRQYETLMRSQRAQIKQLKEAGVDKEYIQAAQAKYLNTMHEYQQFSAKMGLPEQMQRVYIDGLGRMSGGRIPSKAMSIKSPTESMYKGKKWTGKATKHSNDEIQKLKDYAAQKRIALIEFNRYDGDIELVREFIDKIEEVGNKYPNLFKNKGRVYIQSSFGLDDETYASADKNVIKINAFAFRDKKMLVEDYDERARIGFFVKGTDYTHIAVHEAGHVLDYNSGVSTKNLYRDVFNRHTTFEFQSELSETISVYASKNREETIAEAFSMYYAGNDKKIIVDILKYSGII